jgi:ribose-phosphate pyrophosphokinase
MQVLNLIRPEKSSVKYKVIQFPDAVHVLEPHSYRVQDLINAYWGDIATPIPDFRGYLKVYPDRGALQRYGGDSTKNVICSKVRDPKTGQLSGFKIENPEVIEENQDLPLVVIDDLCDGGGTFKGIATLSENYKEVYFTNSYRDWGWEALPDNVKVIEVV